MATEYYTMSDERALAIARAIGGSTTIEDVREFCLADWPEGAEHQRWLDTASIDEIADWCCSGWSKTTGPTA